MDPLSENGETGRALPPAGIETSVTYFIVGLGIVLFFMLVVFGIGRVEKLSVDTVRPTSTETAVTSEIVGSDPPQ
jgi:hypothetical protein